jgi:hypothetical protein
MVGIHDTIVRKRAGGTISCSNISKGFDGAQRPWLGRVGVSGVSYR